MPNTISRRVAAAAGVALAGGVAIAALLLPIVTWLRPWER